MSIFNANTIIRELRKASGLTQEQLAEGICSRSTINMIEQGKRKPDWYTFKNIAYKLGVDPTIYYKDIASEEDSYIINKRNECDKLLIAGDFEALKVEYDKMGNDKRFSKGEGYMFYLQLKSMIYQEKSKDFEASLQCLLELAKLYRPDFELNKVPEYFLTLKEINNINSIAIAYYHLEGVEKSIETFKMLQSVLEKNYVVINQDERLNKQYFTNIRNLCYDYIEVEQYEECITNADKGIARYNGSNHTYIYALLLYHKAFSLMKLGRKDEGELLYKKFFMYNFILDKFADKSIDYKKEFVKEFGYSLNLSVQW